MHDEHLLDAFGDVDISVGMDGWQATIPGGYRPLVALGLGCGIPLFSLVFAFLAWVSTPWSLVLVVPMFLLMSYGGLSHAWRAARSTHLSVRNDDLRIQRRLLGRDRGEPVQLDPAAVPPVEIVGVKGLKMMTIGEVTVPVHAAQEDLDQLTALLNESRQLAASDAEQAPVPEALRRMMAAMVR